VANLPQKLPADMMQQKWASQLNPILKIPMLSGLQLTNIPLNGGTPTVVNHLLGRKQQGWIVTDNDNADSIIRIEPLNDKTLTLLASQACNVSLWVY
jgi:hypothetical protein